MLWRFKSIQTYLPVRWNKEIQIIINRRRVREEPRLVDFAVYEKSTNVP